MSMVDLFAHFDPNHDGAVGREELVSALRGLDLGLSIPQLEQLIINLGKAREHTRQHSKAPFPPSKLHPSYTTFPPPTPLSLQVLTISMTSPQ